MDRYPRVSRIATRAGIMRNPLSPAEALEYPDSWFAQPNVKSVPPGDNHWATFASLLRASGTGGNLTTDAHLAALALELGCSIASADNASSGSPA